MRYEAPDWGVSCCDTTDVFSYISSLIITPNVVTVPPFVFVVLQGAIKHWVSTAEGVLPADEVLMLWVGGPASSSTSTNIPLWEPRSAAPHIWLIFVLRLPYTDQNAIILSSVTFFCFFTPVLRLKIDAKQICCKIKLRNNPLCLWVWSLTVWLRSQSGSNSFLGNVQFVIFSTTHSTARWRLMSCKSEWHHSRFLRWEVELNKEKDSHWKPNREIKGVGP